MASQEIKHTPAQLLPLEEARRRIRESVQRVTESEIVRLDQALGRVVFKDVVCPIDVPSHTNSALDGFAVNGEDLPRSGVRELELIGTAWAGNPYAGRVERGQAVRIMTGAAMPPGTDTIIAREFAEATHDTVKIDHKNETGQNVRQRGEDLALGEVALAGGKRLMPAELGLLASLGFAEVEVFRRLRVAFFSTGDELRQAGEPLGTGGVYDSNRFTLMGMLSRLGVELIDKGVIRDQREKVHTALMDAAKQADVIITSGGVSTGDADYVEEVLSAAGEVGFWRVAIKPGRPLAFGQLGKALFFGLPGNPVAVMVTFYQFLRFALSAMMGESAPSEAPLLQARCTTRLNKKAGRTEFYRAVLEADASGAPVVRKTKKQGSGVLHSMSEANCFIVLNDECAGVEPGDLVSVQPFFGLV